MNHVFFLALGSLRKHPMMKRSSVVFCLLLVAVTADTLEEILEANDWIKYRLPANTLNPGTGITGFDLYTDGGVGDEIQVCKLNLAP